MTKVKGLPEAKGNSKGWILAGAALVVVLIVQAVARAVAAVSPHALLTAALVAAGAAVVVSAMFVLGRPLRHHGGKSVGRSWHDWRARRLHEAALILMLVTLPLAGFGAMVTAGAGGIIPFHTGWSATVMTTAVGVLVCRWLSARLEARTIRRLAEAVAARPEPTVVEVRHPEPPDATPPLPEAPAPRPAPAGSGALRPELATRRRSSRPPTQVAPEPTYAATDHRA